ncbi:hypothetical protein PPL_05601 [Heterostelium album PN500]|uniref:G domain-containing protein n=1 Tax=Heterostelium pallidum (strain ATCC 26659 / Pp 5 / PN500) TaxID=670386 RepID=D3BAM3_HETP5|nr:hypothetical protein PPL_05601 [Heterostelium album PN500]EFA81610.1 hypothetical protein PPL_05601 [Heterostelium album PN500]|eukprot:XP_020433727.1 hypothetical protein PPL_05601 [Heterostelium album PN500]
MSNINVTGFYGNPGVGKSTLCNAMAGQTFHNSGISIGTGLTKASSNEKFINGNIIDTPGLLDVITRDRAALEIQRILTDYPNFKAVFVICLEAGRIKEQDIECINTILRAITSTTFSYGLIINKISKKTMTAIQDSPEILNEAMVRLDRKPSSTLYLPFNQKMEDEDNVLLEGIHRFKLLKFVNNLSTNNLEANQVKALNIVDQREIDRRKRIEDQTRQLLNNLTQETVSKRNILTDITNRRNQVLAQREEQNRNHSAAIENIQAQHTNKVKAMAALIEQAKIM